MADPSIDSNKDTGGTPVAFNSEKGPTTSKQKLTDRPSVVKYLTMSAMSPRTFGRLAAGVGIPGVGGTDIANATPGNATRLTQVDLDRIIGGQANTLLNRLRSTDQQSAVNYAVGVAFAYPNQTFNPFYLYGDAAAQTPPTERTLFVNGHLLKTQGRPWAALGVDDSDRPLAGRQTDRSQPGTKRPDLHGPQSTPSSPLDVKTTDRLMTIGELAAALELPPGSCVTTRNFEELAPLPHAHSR
jgi:hypothetical protein